MTNQTRNDREILESDIYRAILAYYSRTTKRDINAGDADLAKEKARLIVQSLMPQL